MEKNYLLFKRPNNFEEDPNEKLDTFCSEKNREIFLKTQKISTANLRVNQTSTTNVDDDYDCLKFKSFKNHFKCF